MSARQTTHRGSESTFEANPLLNAARRGALEQELEHLKQKLLGPILSSVQNAALLQELRWVANEAAALAWFTLCPVLVLPMLLEEKVHAALERWERQQSLRQKYQV